MIILASTTDKIEAVLAGSVTTNQLQCYSSYRDITCKEYTPGNKASVTNNTTDVEIVSAPAARIQRVVDMLSIFNSDTVSAIVTVKFQNVTSEYVLFKATLGKGELLTWNEGKGWQQFDIYGREKVMSPSISGITGRSAYYSKTGTNNEGTGVLYCFSKDSGFPGAWAIGTPGLAGRTTDGTTSTDAGCLLVNDPASGSNYLVNFNVMTNIASINYIWDILWVNSGIVVTTTTAQTVNSVAFPSRDINGTTNGEGVIVGILVTTTTTNAGAITNMTISYTNSDGTAGRTGTVASFAATAQAGTVYLFNLQAGDKGVRSIQSVTLGTSLVTGAVSLIAFRNICTKTNIQNSVGSDSTPYPLPGVRLYNGSCLFPVSQGSVNTSNINSQGEIIVIEQ